MVGPSSPGIALVSHIYIYARITLARIVVSPLTSISNTANRMAVCQETMQPDWMRRDRIPGERRFNNMLGVLFDSGPPPARTPYRDVGHHSGGPGAFICAVQSSMCVSMVCGCYSRRHSYCEMADPQGNCPPIGLTGRPSLTQTQILQSPFACSPV